MSYESMGYSNFLSREPNSMTDVFTPEEASNMLSPNSIQGFHIGRNVIRADQVQVGLKAWSSNVIWSNATLGQIAWNGHTLTFADGTNIAINAGSYTTSNTTDKFYLYWERGTNEYQITTDYATAIGNNRIIVASFKRDTTTGRITIAPTNNDGTLINGSQISTGIISSQNGLSYWDLNNNKFIMNDGTNDILGFGEL